MAREVRVPVEFPVRLRALRINRGLTQKQLAEPLYTKAYISMLESGSTRASMRALMHLSGRLGISLPELLGGLPANGVPNLGLIPTAALLQEIERRVHA